MPSNRAGRAASAPRERSFSASVLNSTRRKPTSNACRSIRYFASTFAPLPQCDGASHVQPISTTRCSGRMARSRVLPIAAPVGASSVANGPARPDRRSASASSNHSWNVSRDAAASTDIHVQMRGSCAATQSPSSCGGSSGSTTTRRPSSRRARSVDIPPLSPHGHDPHMSVQREAEQARLLLEAARYLNETLDEARVYDRFHELLTDAIHHGGVVVSSYDEDEELIRCDYAWVDGERLDPAIFPPLPLNRRGGGMQSRVITTGEPLLVNDVPEQVKDPKGVYYDVDREGTLRKVPEEGPPGVHAAMMLPVKVGGQELWLSFVAVRSRAGVVYAFRDLSAERRLDEAQSDFIATVSHELRTPMTAVLGAAKTLLRDDIDLSPEKRRELLE